MSNNNTNKKNTNRYGNKWSINETLQLQREFELLGLKVQEIASNHKRSVVAILYRLEMEGFKRNLNDNETTKPRKMQLRSRNESTNCVNKST